MLAIEKQKLLPSFENKCIIFPQSPQYPMLKKKKVNDPWSAIAVYAWVTQSLIGLVS